MARKKVAKKKKSFQEEIWDTIRILPQAFLFVLIINGVAIASFVVPTGSMEDTVMTGDFLFVNRFIYGPTTPQIIPLLNIELPYYKFPGIWEPEKNDVIVFVYPGDYNKKEPDVFQYYLKRCVAVAGDTLEVRNKRIFVNGEEYELPYKGKHIYQELNRQAEFPPGTRSTLDNYGSVVIPKIGDEIEINKYNMRQWKVFIEREGHELTFDSKSIYIDGKETNKYIVERDYCFGMGDNRHNSADSRSFGFIPYENVVGTPMFVYWSWDTNSPLIGGFINKLKTIRWDRLGTIIN